MRFRLVPILLATLALAGCEVGPGEELEDGAQLRITRDFGSESLGAARVDRIRDGQTVMRFLKSEREVKTRYGGNFVQAIDGLAGTGQGGRRDWFYWVNGIEASVGAAEYELSPGDVVQWDYRDWRAAMRIPAIVGAYPEPFVSGTQGKRLPVRVECEDADGAACRDVKGRLSELGIAASGARLGAPGTERVLRVVVARWAAARQVSAVRALERGPSETGVFARFTEDGETLELLDERGRVARRAPVGSGLVAATEAEGQGTVWIVTGADGLGLVRAAQALEPEALRDAFAVAAIGADTVELPLAGGGDRSP